MCSLKGAQSRRKLSWTPLTASLRPPRLGCSPGALRVLLAQASTPAYWFSTHRYTEWLNGIDAKPGLKRGQTQALLPRLVGPHPSASTRTWHDCPAFTHRDSPNACSPSNSTTTSPIKTSSSTRVLRSARRGRTARARVPKSSRAPRNRSRPALLQQAATPKSQGVVTRYERLPCHVAASPHHRGGRLLQRDTRSVLPSPTPPE